MSADPTAAPAFRHQLHCLREPEQFGIAISGAHLRADFLAPQAAPTRIEQFQAPGWALDFHEAHVKARIHAPLPPGWATIGLLRSQAPSSWYGAGGARGVLLCNPPGEAIDGCITPGFHGLAVHVPVAEWERCRALAGAGDVTFGRFAAHPLPPAIYTRLEHRLRAVRRLLGQAGAAPQFAASAAREAASFAAEVAATAWEVSANAVPPPDSLRNRARLARRAEAWLHDRLAEPVQIPDVCLALRVSRRELEYAFRVAFDQSPRDFLQALRLNAVRRALRRADVAVLRAALDHGFTHPGRFAAHYRALFGESPSETGGDRRAASGYQLWKLRS